MESLGLYRKRATYKNDCDWIEWRKNLYGKKYKLEKQKKLYIMANDFQTRVAIKTSFNCNRDVNTLSEKLYANKINNSSAFNMEALF